MVQRLFRSQKSPLRLAATGLLVLLAGWLALGLGGCSLRSFRSDAAQVSEVIIATPSDPTTFNPPLNDSLYSTYVFGLTTQGLVQTNGLTGEIEPALAESWEISPDQKRIVFTLRQGLQWSDGEPLTVEDVLFSFNDVYLNEAVPTSTRNILETGDGSYPTVTPVGDRRVQFSVTQPYAPLLRNSGVTILPKHVLAPTLNERDSGGNLRFLSTWGTDTPLDQLVVNGPYQLESYEPSQRLVFKRNPHYWRRAETGETLPRIERIVMQIIESDTNQMMRFRSGELDTLTVKPEAFPLLKREEERGQFTLYNGGPEPGSRLMVFNLNQASKAGKPLVDPIKSRWFNNVLFRQAIAHGINRQQMQDNLFRGIGAIQDSPLDSQSPFYVGPEEGVPVYDYDPERSKALLQEAGFRYNNRGELLDDRGNPVVFSLLVKSEEKVRLDMTAQISQDLAKIGITANQQVVNFNTVLQKLERQDWEAYVGGFGGGNPDPHSGFNIWNSNGFLHQFNQGPRPDESDVTGWVVSDWERRIDALFAQGVQQLDDAKRKPIYAEFQRLAQEQLPFIYLVKPLQLEAVRDRLQGIQYSALGGALWNLDELTVLD